MLADEGDKTKLTLSDVKRFREELEEHYFVRIRFSSGGTILRQGQWFSQMTCLAFHRQWKVFGEVAAIAASERPADGKETSAWQMHTLLEKIGDELARADNLTW